MNFFSNFVVNCPTNEDHANSSCAEHNDAQSISDFIVNYHCPHVPSSPGQTSDPY